jgi:signal transduction histidine kinase/CheY-like chemotaxis protein
VRQRILDRLRSHWAVPVAFVMGLTATVIVADGVEKVMVEKDATRFGTVCDRVARELDARVEGYVAILRAGGTLLALNPDLDAASFRRFVDQVELRAKYPGVDGIGYSRRTIDRGDEHHDILFVEPRDDRNRAAIGTDMSRDPTRRAAMDLARDTGAAVATAPLVLTHTPSEPPPAGFLVFFPVYQGWLPGTIQERRARLAGFVYARFRASDLFPGIWGTGPSPFVTFEVFDEGIAPPKFLYRSASYTEAPRFTGERQLRLYGRRWSVRLRSTGNLDDPSSRNLVPSVVTAGVGLTLLLTSFVAMQTRARRRGEKTEARIQQLLASERELRAEAERVSQVKDEFLATLSHELRTPLNAIVGWTQLMSAPGTSDEARHKAVAIVQRNAQVQTQLIDDLLDMSRIVAGKLRLEMKNLDPAAVVEESINVVRPTASAKGIALETAIDTEVPSVRGDAARLQQVLWNLLNNSMKFTPAGGRVRVTLRGSPSQVEIGVTDTGAGIPPALLPYIFDRFRQGDGSTTRRHGGLGLGLSIVKSLVEMHGGTIRAASAGAGKGASFVLTLPASAAPQARPLDAGSPGDGAAPALHGIRVLVVEDDADSAELVTTMLQNSGALVTVCPSATEALEQIGKGLPIDVIVSDLGMPGVDGFEFLRRVRALPAAVSRALPAIALSAYASPDDRRRAHEAGYQVHISKPFDVEDLVAACIKVLRLLPL